jgi:hypothetical protein
MLADRAPATRPSVESNSDAKVAAAPATQPVAAAPTSQPMALAPSTQPAFVEANEADDAIAGLFAAAPATAPSTQPVAAADESVEEKAAQSTVVELPLDEVPAFDANK